MSGTAHTSDGPADRTFDGPLPSGPDPTTVATAQRRTVRVLMSAQVVAGIGIGSTLSAGALLIGRLSGSEALAGLSTTSATLGAALLGIPLAALSRSRGRRVGLGTGWLIAAVGAVIVLLGARLGRPEPVLLGTLLLGAGTATNLQSRYAAADLADDGNRARSLSLVVWSTTVGSVIGPNLTGPGEPVARALGLPEEAGTFLFSTVAFLGGWALNHFLLRPDPLHLAAALARAGTGGTPGAAPAPDTPAAPRFTARFAEALRVVRAVPAARLGLVTVVLGHAVMVSVMTMTPIHLAHHGADLSVVGFSVSLHIAGMYALSPLVGRLADCLGRIPVILLGQALYLLTAAVAGLAGTSHVAAVGALFTLGLGWSFVTIGGSTLLTESLPAAQRSEIQGLADTLMNLAGAAGGAAAGGLVALLGYGGLNGVAALLTLPVLALALAPRTRA
ncbi:MFS transporter [Streptomyces catenulae]|uniref:MFS transporter n=1 Tax=Streptomyces catenulae TaxID=66875 RepID=A0ABV2Z2Q4_9ACTN|nr:MFS transporter [Streptomyces catenulae]